MENYGQKYKEALERARKLQENSNGMILKKWLWNIFPELKESEDEKIRKELKHYLEVRRCQTKDNEEYINCNHFLAWLEKHGNKPQGKSALDEIKEEVDNQTCVKGDGKVEPKFHEGDWLVNNETCDYLKVTKVIDNTYKILNQKGEQFYIQKGVAEDNCHKFTINDANDGDVLVDVYGNIGIYQTKCTAFDWTSYCHLGRYGRFLSFKAVHANDGVQPATKEQHDLLFQEMRKEGYKWDAKKKVLNKSQRMISAEAKEALYGTCNYEQKYKEALSKARELL